jgi:hypothetical protein
MGWMSAIGQGGLQGMDRYAQWRQMDTENQRNFAKDAMLKAEAASQEDTAKLTRQQIQNAILKEKRAAFTEAHMPGSSILDSEMLNAQDLGLGAAIDPQSRTFKGTFNQQNALAQAEREKAQHAQAMEVGGQTITENKMKLAEAERINRSAVDFQNLMKQNPKMGVEKLALIAAQTGANLHPAIEKLLAQKQAVAIANLNSASAYAKANAEFARKVPPGLEVLQEQYGKTLAEGMPTLGGLMGKLAAQPVKEGSIDPALGALYQYPDLQRQYRTAQQGLGGKTAPTPGSSPAAQQWMEMLPIYMGKVGASGLEDLFQQINTDQALSGSDKLALRQAARKYAGEVGWSAPGPYPQGPQQKPGMMSNLMSSIFGVK